MPKLSLGAMIATGLLIRLALAPIGAHPFDTYVWYDTAQRFGSGLTFYGVTQYSYPPAWAGILGAIDAVYRPLAAALNVHPLTSSQVNIAMGHPVFLAAPLLIDWLFLLLMKLPLIAADLGLALILRRIASTRLHDAAAGDRAFAWYFLNPYVIWISSVWGMFDVLPTFFTIAGILFFLEGRDVVSGIAFGLAVSLKYFPILFALGLLVAYRGSLTRTRLLRFAAGFVLFLAAISAPFLLSDPSAFVQGVLSPTSGAYAGRVSIWEALGAFGAIGIPLWVAAADILATVILVGILTALRGRRPATAISTDLWIESSLIAVFTFYVVNYAVNPQYFVWVIPFLTLDSLVRRETPRVLVITTGALLAYIVTGVEHYSFFLPLLTISTGLGGFVLPMPSIPAVTYVLGFVVWVVMLDQLRIRVHRAGGALAIRRTIIDFLSALHVAGRST